MRRLFYAALLVPVLILAACGESDLDVTGGEPEGPGEPEGDGGGTVPDDGLLVSIEVGGGQMFPPRHRLGSPPTSTAYNDGTTVTTGAVVAIYPGPAVTPLIKGELDNAGVERIRTLAEDAGLFDEDLDVGDPQVTDAGSMVITVGTADGQIETNIYAPHETSGAGLTAEQQEARDRIRTFVEETDKLVTAAETNERFKPERYRVAALEAEVADPNIEPGRLDWPLDGVPDPSPEGCTPITSEDAATLAAALGDATEITIWTAGGKDFQLDVRPLLPHEPDCP